MEITDMKRANGAKAQKDGVTPVRKSEVWGKWLKVACFGAALAAGSCADKTVEKHIPIPSQPSDASVDGVKPAQDGGVESGAGKNVDGGKTLDSSVSDSGPVSVIDGRAEADAAVVETGAAKIDTGVPDEGVASDSASGNGLDSSSGNAVADTAPEQDTATQKQDADVDTVVSSDTAIVQSTDTAIAVDSAAVVDSPVRLDSSVVGEDAPRVDGESVDSGGASEGGAVFDSGTDRLQGPACSSATADKFSGYISMHGSVDVGGFTITYESVNTPDGGSGPDSVTVKVACGSEPVIETRLQIGAATEIGSGDKTIIVDVSRAGKGSLYADIKVR